MSGIPQQRASLTRVAIIEDQREFRDGLAFLIDGSEGYRCTQTFGSMEEALDRMGLDLPDLVLVDIGLPGISGIEGIGLLKQRYPGLPVLMLTVYNDDERIFQAMCAGSFGYLLKTTADAGILVGN